MLCVHRPCVRKRPQGLLSYMNACYKRGMPKRRECQLFLSSFCNIYYLQIIAAINSLAAVELLQSSEFLGDNFHLSHLIEQPEFDWAHCGETGFQEAAQRQLKDKQKLCCNQMMQTLPVEVPLISTFLSPVGRKSHLTFGKGQNQATAKSGPGVTSTPFPAK